MISASISVHTVTYVVNIGTRCKNYILVFFQSLSHDGYILMCIFSIQNPKGFDSDKFTADFSAACRQVFETCRDGLLILRALAIRASNPQNVLARVSFLAQNFPLHPPPHRDDAVAMASNLAISPKLPRPVLLVLESQAAFGFFLSSSLHQLSELRKYTSKFWQGITSHFQTYQRNTH